MSCSVQGQSWGWQGEGLRTHTRIVAPNPGEFSPMLFMIASEFSEFSQDVLTQRTVLFHHDYYQAVGGPIGTTVGIMLTPSRSKQRRWDTTMVALDGDHGLTPEDIAEIRSTVTDAAQRAQPA